ncbi:MAG: zinc ribbon domain-containing protein [Candidatus Altiarchaeota archaeon]|nr:zinc ribbon domain-containing protein [Candidatus Altiarchaeota archaeon]
MAYEQGSMGVGLLVGFLVFLGLNAILGMLIPFCIMGICVSLGGYGALLGTVIPGWAFLFSGVFTTHFIGALFVPLIAGVLAGLIAKGGAGRGFIAGFVSNLLGYYVSFLMVFFIYLAAVGTVATSMDSASMDYGYYDGYGSASSITGLASQTGPGIGTPVSSMGSISPGDILGWIIVLLIIPLIVGVLGGIGGAIISAILSKPAGSVPQASTTNIIQATPGYYPPQQSVQQPPQPVPEAEPEATATKKAGKTLACPNCGNQNQANATFCDECGSRLKKR